MFTQQYQNNVHGYQKVVAEQYKIRQRTSIHATVSESRNGAWILSTRYLTITKSAASVSPYHICHPVAFWSLSALKHLQGPYHQCPECGVGPYDVEHLFNCPSYPMQLTMGQPTCCSIISRNIQQHALQTSSTWTTSDYQ